MHILFQSVSWTLGYCCSSMDVNTCAFLLKEQNYYEQNVQNNLVDFLIESLIFERMPQIYRNFTNLNVKSRVSRV